MSQRYLFDVFGRIVSIETRSDGWAAFYIGHDGKRRRADFQIPGFIDGDQLAQYLDDLFHEDASLERPSVVPLSRGSGGGH
ncbi:DUF7661 family protein [Paraburkholderia caribensis]|jgi:hypothetical protein|uniref:DUF7661 family protein n=1 Tax=Paraburkholderia caribensis TaxID=75105 RepID=UPI001D08398B|nr:hypothetical protein [Paraburkholderia caribensis]MDR6384702.1 hypothetical protein [Paraburkholderia caribensis]